ncbi:MAG: hypothetical protein IKG00_00070 [Lachnospiraceae bacterium]|nr:hypothetical protein [Lachnospiraceae bacterium]
MAKKKEPFNQAAYNKEYNRETYSRVSIYLSRIYDQDILEYLKTKPSKSDYMKKLIRKDMNPEKDNSEEWPE